LDTRHDLGRTLPTVVGLAFAIAAMRRSLASDLAASSRSIISRFCA